MDTKICKYKIIIGLEVHIEPNTKQKMFCRCPQDHFGKVPNSQTCPVCLGLPGALPFSNKEAIDRLILLGLALGSEINKESLFYRKHYFYPDLPKGFQTSQLDSPFCVGGSLMEKQINRVHLEEDSGKLVHETIDGEKVSLIDFNRSGCSLIELVTEPVFSSVNEVISFVKELQLIVKYLDISNADMEKGTMRLEANISLSKDGNLPNYKVELKNINSFKFLEKAINAEIDRQETALDSGEVLIQETRGYDEIKKTTFSQRTKADSHDYRYFPEADLPPIVITEKDIEIIKKDLKELPNTKRLRFENEYNLSKDYIEVFISDLDRANYFEQAVKLSPNLVSLIANVMINKNMDKDYPEPGGLVKKLIEITKVPTSSNTDVETSVDTVLGDNPDVVESYKQGKGQVIGFLIGQVQKILQGNGDPKIIQQKLLDKLHG